MTKRELIERVEVLEEELTVLKAKVPPQCVHYHYYTAQQPYYTTSQPVLPNYWPQYSPLFQNVQGMQQGQLGNDTVLGNVGMRQVN